MNKCIPLTNVSYNLRLVVSIRRISSISGAIISSGCGISRGIVGDSGSWCVAAVAIVVAVRCILCQGAGEHGNNKNSNLNK